MNNRSSTSFSGPVFSSSQRCTISLDSAHMQRPGGIVVVIWLVGLMNLLGIFLAVRMAPETQVLAAGLAIAVIGLVAVGCCWNGLHWGRWIVLLESLVCLWNVTNVRREDATQADVTVMVAEAVLAVFFLVYFNWKPVRTWFDRER